MNYTYEIVDRQTGEVVVENQSLNDLREFANDLYWQDNVSFENASFEEVRKIIQGCDYEVR